MRAAESLTVGFFAYLFAIAAARDIPRARMVRLGLLAAACSIPIILLAELDRFPVARTLRDWLPGLYLLLGYWAAGLTYEAPRAALEDRLRRIDGRLFALAGPVLMRAPRAALEAIELAYLLYYPLVPAGLVVLYATGHRAQADSYWVAVLLAAFAACAVLPLAGTRPPRAVACEMCIEQRRLSLHRFNCAVLAHGSIQVNTFPSAHAATSTAVAVFLAPLGWTALPFAIVAAGIGIGAVAGRYHYALDVVFGVLIGAGAGFVAGR